MVTFEQVRKSLPKIGDHRHGGIVDYVNEDKFWYRVASRGGRSAIRFQKHKQKRTTNINKSSNQQKDLVRI